MQFLLNKCAKPARLVPANGVKERCVMALNECPMKKFPRLSIVLLVTLAAVLVARWVGLIGW